jgi:hypothetical protein
MLGAILALRERLVASDVATLAGATSFAALGVALPGWTASRTRHLW